MVGPEVVPDAEALLVAQLRAARRSRRWAALLLLAICVVGGTVALLSFDLRDRVAAKAVAGGAVGTVLALVLLATTLGDPRRNRTVETLRNDPGSVVWFYVVQPPRPPWTEKAWARSVPGIVAESTLMTCLADGTRLKLTVQAGSEQAVLDAVKIAAPKALGGYSAAREARYKRAPASVGDASSSFPPKA
jgi:hypothetical protein